VLPNCPWVVWLRVGIRHLYWLRTPVSITTVLAFLRDHAGLYYWAVRVLGFERCRCQIVPGDGNYLNLTAFLVGTGSLVVIAKGSSMSVAEALPAHLPYLRRFARALTGSQATGDRYALAALEAAVENPVRMHDVPDTGVWLYRLLLKIWGAAASPRVTAVDMGSDVSADAANRNLEAMTPLPRAAFLLHWVEGFSMERIAAVLECPVSRVHSLIEQAGREIAEQITTDVLIIEDEPIISMDLEALVKDLGHRVTHVARTRTEAIKAVKEHFPGLVLADIHLADNSSGLDAVNEILGGREVPVVFITAYPERLLTGSRPEPTFLITKPFRSETVKAAISQVLFFDVKAHRDLAAV
jgi:DNA-directed RNA polymerase specialized sigma24 family protein